MNLVLTFIFSKSSSASPRPLRFKKNSAVGGFQAHHSSLPITEVSINKNLVVTELSTPL